MGQHRPLDHRRLYRLPWSVTDNIISWLEPTKQCNLYCQGCYSANVAGSHKSLATIAHELGVFERFRQTDAVSIAGGDPLTHPQIVEIVRLVAQRGLKPIVNTNGLALTPELLRELKAAGLKGFTFHIDSLQKRPGWTGKSEIELNELRLHYARLAASVGGLSCAFNATVYDENIEQVADIVEWGREHIDIVHILVFIAIRAVEGDGRFDYYVGDRKIETKPLAYDKIKPVRNDIGAPDIVARLRERCGEFEPCAYLNGTEKPDSFKWLMTLRIGDGKRILGYAGPKFAELAQVVNHLRHGRYQGYLAPAGHRRARLMLLLSGLDEGVRTIWKRDLAATLCDPLRLFRPLHLQSVMIIQPVDVLADGRLSMCDSCPDVTVYKDELVWSCRLDERFKFGQLMRLAPAARAADQEREETEITV
jgi:MoaA/NifB/PqqE/SkfB family radical SAM enzyme